MKIIEFPFPIEIGSVCDIDFFQDGSQLSIQGSHSQQVLMWNQKRIALPADWSCPEFPIIRALLDGRALVIDTGFYAARQKNAWIINSSGNVEAHFEIGSAAVDVVVLHGMLAVAYHPISAKAFGHQIQPLQRTGIAFFDYQGRTLMGFNQEAAKYGISVENVRCMTALSRSQIIFVPEKLSVCGEAVENPVVHYDCASGRPRIYSAPMPRAEAVTMADGLIQIASPESWEDHIITFDAETKISQHRGEFLGIYRGLEGGAFLAQLSTSDYAVVIPGRPENFPRTAERFVDTFRV
jgi:hypothetical protein